MMGKVARPTARMGDILRVGGGPSNNAVPVIPITPQIASNFQRRLSNADNDDDLTKIVRDAAKYGVDWSHLLSGIR